jgi:hypothetical protein
VATVNPPKEVVCWHMRRANSRPALRGALLALLAAVLFGVSTPLVQRYGSGVGAFTTAAVLYAGAAAVSALSRRRIEREARVMRSDLPRLLQRTSGTSASLMRPSVPPVTA